MPKNPNKISRFWQELKRRRVIHVITVYASATFVIIELVNNLAEPLNLPATLPIIVIVVLAIGFPLAIILSWLYDLTSEGVEKTKPLSEIKEGEKPVVPNAWKIATYVSFVVIIGLVVLNVLGGGKQLRAGDIQSLLILPVENNTGDDQLDWFVDGMHAALIHDMGRISSFDVLNRTSSCRYKNVDMTLQEIASALDRDILIKPDVMCLGDTICLMIEVIRAFPEEKTLWIEEYKEAKSEIPNLYNRLTKQIADEMKIELTDYEDEILAESRTVDTAALDAYFNGLFYLDKIDRPSLQKASEYFNVATKIDPDYAPAYAGLAMVGAYQMQMSFNTPLEVRQKIYEDLNKALELDPNSSVSHFTKAIIALNTEWNWEKSEKEFLKSIELNPSNALYRIFYAHLLNILHRYDEAIYQANLALKLDPYRPFILVLYANAMEQMGNYQSAINYDKKALSIDSTHRLAIKATSRVSRQIGDYEKWFEGWRRITWHNEEVITKIQKVFQEKGYLAAIEAIIKVDEEAPEEIQSLATGQAARYLVLNKCDKAMDRLELLYEIHHPAMVYVSTWHYDLDQLMDNPRYIELLKKMNLPMPED